MNKKLKISFSLFFLICIFLTIILYFATYFSQNKKIFIPYINPNILNNSIKGYDGLIDEEEFIYLFEQEYLSFFNENTSIPLFSFDFYDDYVETEVKWDESNIQYFHFELVDKFV